MTYKTVGTGLVVLSVTFCGTKDPVVTPDVDRVTVEPTALFLQPGQSDTLTATVLDLDGAVIPEANVNWTTADSDVAKVNKNGQFKGEVTAQEGGTTEIRASSGGKTGSASVTVAAGPWFEETWDYSDTNDLWGSRNVEGFYLTRGTVSLLTGLENTPWGGTKAVQLSFEGGAKVYQEVGVNLRPPRADNDRPREVWLEVYVRYDEGFEIHSDHKTIFYLETDHTNRWAIHVGVFGTDVQGRINDSPWWDPVWPMPDLPTWIWDGEWHLLRWHLKMSTNGVGGAFEAWLDDESFLRSTNIDTASPTNAYFDPIALGRNGDPIAPSSMYWGQLRVYVSDPEWYP
ncbi:Ig-like domain-containing protein [Gemmatimonadota bacterium]